MAILDDEGHSPVRTGPRSKLMTETLFPFGTRRPSRTAMIMGGTPARRAELTQLVKLAGGNIVEMERDSPADFLLVDLCSETERLGDSLPAITQYLEAHQTTALVWTKMDWLEEVYATLPHDQCHYLVEAEDVEAMPILAGAFGRDNMDRLHDRNREVEFGSLHRISDELAEFARTLAQMAASNAKAGVSDRPMSFRPAPLGGFQGFPSTPADRYVESAQLREIIKLRRMRDRFFPTDLFADPAWDILLDLKAAALEGQYVSVSSLCIAAAVPPTTALRWITAMTESGMLARRQDPADARRVFIELLPETSAKLDDYFVAISTRSTEII